LNFESTEDEINASYLTAWTPPIEAMSAIINKYPDLEIDLKYHESEMGFVGRTYLTSDIFDDNCVEYSDMKKFKGAVRELGVENEFENPFHN
jgi:hypothetical protein